MILVLELTWIGVSHAAFNRSLLQTILRAFPQQDVALHADPSHLAEVFAADPPELARVERCSISLPRHYQGRPHVVAWRRFLREWMIVAAAFRRRPDAHLVVLASSTSTGIVAAQIAARLFLRGAVMQVALHGELNAVTGWRSRNPLARMLDLRAILARSKPATPTRFIVQEETIRAALLAEMPDTARRLDVLPHPVPTLPASCTPPLPASCSARPLTPGPLRVGLVGQATREKGIATFLDVAARMRKLAADGIEFHHIGKVPVGADLAPFRVLDSTGGFAGLSQREFHARIQSMHYVFLPLQRGYYLLSASGALLDALARMKPVIVADLPLSRAYFDAYGDIGYLYASVEQIGDVILAARQSITNGHYETKLANVRTAAADRGIEASAQRYRAITLAAVPTLA